MVHKAFNKKWSNFSLSLLTLLTQPLSITFSFTSLDLFIHECFACTCSVHPMSAWCPHRSEEGTQFPRTGGADGCVHRVYAGKQTCIFSKSNKCS